MENDTEQCRACGDYDCGGSCHTTDQELTNMLLERIAKALEALPAAMQRASRGI